jgi:imidazolonepropionase-like amidohydrolase
MFIISRLFAVLMLFPMFLVASPVSAAEEEAPPQILIKNVTVFDGKTEQVGKGINVLIEGNLIKDISASAIQTSSGATIIDGTGMTMTPGLIDMHQHLMLGGPDGLKSTGENIDFATAGGIATQAMQEHLLMKGITTVRDIAGNSLGLAKAVKDGLLWGPRIYSSGPAIAPTGGHTDIG